MFHPLAVCAALASDFVSAHLGEGSLTDFNEDEQAAQQRTFVCNAVLPVLARLASASHFATALAANDDILEGPCERTTDVLHRFLDSTKDQPPGDELHAARVPCRDALLKFHGRARRHTKLAEDGNDDGSGGGVVAEVEAGKAGAVQAVQFSGIELPGGEGGDGVSAAGGPGGVKPPDKPSPQEKLLDFVHDWDADEVMASPRGHVLAALLSRLCSRGHALAPSPPSPIPPFPPSHPQVTGDVTDEFRHLVAVFADNLEQYEHHHSRGSRGHHKDSSALGSGARSSGGGALGAAAQRSEQPKISFLISYLFLSRCAEGDELTPLQVKNSLASMRVLHALLDEASARVDKCKSDIERRIALRAQRRLQTQLDGMGAGHVALSVASCEDGELCEAGLRLAAGLLKGGNLEVQEAMALELVGRAKSGLGQLRPFDGGESSFFEMMKRRLRRGMGEVPERKVYLTQQAERLEDFELEKEELSPAVAALMHEEISRPFGSTAHVQIVLEVLQALCEGHNMRMQYLLREQTANRISVDLISEVNELLIVIESEIDGTNYKQAHACIDALTKFTQGNIDPATGQAGISQLLLDSKLIEVLDRLVQRRSIDGVLNGRFAALRTSLAKLLMALLEGTEREAEQRFLLRLDLMGIARVCGSICMEACGVKAFSDATDGPAGSISDASKATAAAAAGGALAGASALLPGRMAPLTAGEITVRMEQHRGPEQEALLEAGFLLYVLLKHLLDFEEPEATLEGGALQCVIAPPAFSTATLVTDLRTTASPASPSASASPGPSLPAPAHPPLAAL